jgi:hypothetical protein
VWEENASSNVLISVNCISGKEGFDLVCLSIVSKDVYRVVKLVGKFFPFIDSCVCVDRLDLIFFKIIKDNKISILVGAAIASDQ